MKAILYYRYSPRRLKKGADGETKDVDSIEVQREECRSYCNREGIPIEAEYSDELASGGDEEREGIWKAVEAIKKGYVLVAYKSDRIARSVLLEEIIHRDVKKRGGTVYIVTGTPNEDDPQSTLMRQVLAAFSEYERKVIAIRTRTAMLSQSRRGVLFGTPEKCTYGFKADPQNPGRMIVCPEEQKAVKRAVELKQVDSSISLRKIGEILSREGHKPRSGKWHPQLIKDILRREAEGLGTVYDEMKGGG